MSPRGMYRNPACGYGWPLQILSDVHWNMMVRHNFDFNLEFVTKLIVVDLAPTPIFCVLPNWELICVPIYAWKAGVGQFKLAIPTAYLITIVLSS